LAVSGLRPAHSNVAAVSGPYANGGSLAIIAGDAYSERGAAVSATGEPSGEHVAASGTGWTADCRHESSACVAAAGLGDANRNGATVCAAISGLDTVNGGDVAVSGS
jgi:hypothetical protein